MLARVFFPPSRRSRSSSSSASKPARMVPPSTSVAGGRSESPSPNVLATSARRSSCSSTCASALLRSRCARPVRPLNTSGSRCSESRSAPSSRGVARPAAARPARRSRSRTPSSASRTRARPRPSSNATVTASSRWSMAAESARGVSTQDLRSRAPIGVMVESRVSRRVASLVPARRGSTSSRFRVVISSSQQVPSLRRATGRIRCGRPLGCSSARYRSSAPAAPTAGASSGPSPSPSRLFSWNRRASSSAARAGSNSHRSRGVLRTPSSSVIGASPGNTTSAGPRRFTASSSRSAGTVSRKNSPVDMSIAAIPDFSLFSAPAPERHSATRKLFRAPARKLSSSTAPGVSVSITSRLTIPLASLGSSTCSQIATRWPAAMSWRR